MFYDEMIFCSIFPRSLITRVSYAATRERPKSGGKSKSVFIMKYDLFCDIMMCFMMLWCDLWCYDMCFMICFLMMWCVLWCFMMCSVFHHLCIRMRPEVLKLIHFYFSNNDSSLHKQCFKCLEAVWNPFCDVFYDAFLMIWCILWSICDDMMHFMIHLWWYDAFYDPLWCFSGSIWESAWDD